MKSEEEVRRQLKELFDKYQELGKQFAQYTQWDENRGIIPSTDEIELDHKLDLALAKYEALSWVFEDEN